MSRSLSNLMTTDLTTDLTTDSTTDADRIDLAQLVPAACGLGLAGFCFLLLAFCV